MISFLIPVHYFSQRYPMDMYNEFGFVVCSGHQFLRSSPGTLKFMELMNKRCPYGKCDDQVTYNRVFHLDLKIDWDNMNGTTPNKRVGALRVNTSHVENGNLLVESITGRSTVTNHTGESRPNRPSVTFAHFFVNKPCLCRLSSHIRYASDKKTVKVWDRDFAWRVSCSLYRDILCHQFTISFVLNIHFITATTHLHSSQVVKMMMVRGM